MALVAPLKADKAAWEANLEVQLVIVEKQVQQAFDSVHTKLFTTGHHANYRGFQDYLMYHLFRIVLGM